MVAYPSRPAPVDFSGFELGLDALKEGLDERRTRKVLDEYVTSLYGGGQGGQEMSLASLAPSRETTASIPDPASQRVSQAHGDMGGDIFKRFMSTVQAGGLTNPAALAAVASTGKNESGFSAGNAFGTWSDPSQSGQPGTSGGILSWRGERLSNLQKFAQQNGDNPNAPTPETQAKFLLQENPQLIAQLQKARTPQEAQQMMNNAWRFAGYDQPGGEAGERIADAQALVGQFGGQQPSQDALTALSGGQGVQMAQASPAASGGSLLPPADVMRGLLRNPQTRQLGIVLAQQAQKARQGDPLAQVELEKAKLELEKLRNPKPDLINAGDGRLYDPARREWIEAPGGNTDASQRAASAAEFGLTPDDPAYRSYVLTGKMPREDQAPLTATDKKAILEADEMVQSNESTIQLLQSVLAPGEGGKSLNDRAGYGATAGAQSWMARNDPTGLFDDAKGEATTELQNVVLNQALANLKATFGAAPTEGERKILVDLQASIDKTPAERKTIIERAIAAAERRMQFNQQRVDELRGGSFYKPGGGKSASGKGNRTSSGVEWSLDD